MAFFRNGGKDRLVFAGQFPRAGDAGNPWCASIALFVKSVCKLAVSLGVTQQLHQEMEMAFARIGAEFRVNSMTANTQDDSSITVIAGVGEDSDAAGSAARWSGARAAIAVAGEYGVC